MRIAVDINHPAHVHFFRNFIREVTARGHEVMITASDKDVALRLLELYRLPYRRLPGYRGGLARKLIRILYVDWAAWRALRDFRPRVATGIASARMAHAAFLLPGCESWIFDDTEHAWGQILLYLPFADRVFTPACFTRDLGRKQVRYPGCHELAYVHPARFTPDPRVAIGAGLTPGEPYFVLRFVSWEATHDIGHRGLTVEGKRRLVRELGALGRVVLTSEAEPPAEFAHLRLRLTPDTLLDLLAFARLYVGEGATVASEAALLGVPAVYVNTLAMGYIAEEARHGLLFHLPDNDRAIAKCLELARDEDRAAWQARRERLLAGKCDVTAWMVSRIDALAAGGKV